MMNIPPLISVIVPVYNVFNYLQKCVDSIINQSYQRWELILVDDGSTDQSGILCDKIASTDSRIFSFHKDNGGLSSARNYGIEQSKGDYIIFVDSDDYWTNNEVLDQFISTVLAHNADIVRGEFQYVNEEGKNLEPINYINKKKYEHKLLDSDVFFKEVINGKYFAVLFLFKREIFNLYRFDEDCKFQEDIEICIRIFSNNWKCAYINNSFYSYRLRSQSLTSTVSYKNITGSLKHVESFDLFSYRIKKKDFRSYYRHISIMMYYWTLDTISNEPYFSQRNTIFKNTNIAYYKKIVLRNIVEIKRIRLEYLPLLLPPSSSVAFLHVKNTTKRFVKKIIKR